MSGAGGDGYEFMTLADEESQKPFGGQSMTGVLRRVLVCSPVAAGWGRAEKVSAWRDLGFHHTPDSSAAQGQHNELCRLLGDAGAEVIALPASESLSLDAVYAHDASLVSDDGMVLMNPGKANRVAEARVHAECCARLGVPVLGEVVAPATTEAGDIVWLDSSTLLVGHGYRTNRVGIERLRALFAEKGVEVIAAPLPYGAGPSECLHLMSLMSVLDERTMLVDLAWLAVETVELLRGRGFQFIGIDTSERDTLACNVLSLGGGRLIALAENVKTNQRLRERGFDVRTFAGSELCINGSGGPTCLTRPLLRG